jgi:hypothetical protein
MVTAGPDDLDSDRRHEATGISVLNPNGEDRLRDVTSILSEWPRPECGLSDLAPWLRWLDLRLDHFRDEGDGVGVQPVDQLAMKWFATEQYRFTYTKIIDSSSVLAA